MKSNQLRDEARAIIDDCGSLIENEHFVYASGNHGSGWIAKDVINLNPERPRRLGELMADAVRGIECDVVCGPAVGGLICAQYTALAMSKTCLFAERVTTEAGEQFVLKRGQAQEVTGMRVLIVDDVVNTGYSIGLVRESVAQCGGIVVGAATWISRGNVGARELGVEQYFFLDEVSLPSWPAEDCPLCEEGISINTTYAHGAEFLAGGR